MSSSEEIIRTLRNAVSVSPDNVPLRQHLADTLLSYGRFSEAEEEYRAGLAMAGSHQNLQIGLVKALFQQSKLDLALSTIDNLLKNSPDIIPAEVYLLHCRVLLQKGRQEQAIGEYFKAIDADSKVADPTLVEQLGLKPGDQFSLSQTFYHPENEDSSPPVAAMGPSDFSGDDDEIVDGRIRIGVGEEFDDLPLEIERPSISFSDVGGMESLKEEIQMKIIHPLAHPEIYAAYGKKVGGGILMYGPPGCGKTHLARATAGEVKANFLSVGINDVLDMWLGNSERNLHELFETARRNTPCVLFFDEVDALAAKRTDMRLSAGRHIINQFLSELDGVKYSNEGMLILAATNAPWHLDSAFLRPGRYDRVIFVPPPDQTAKASILRILLKDKPVQDVDYNYLAKKLKEFSGADLKATIDVAVEAKLSEAMKKGVPSPLKTRDLQQAAKKIKPSTKDWFSTARNYALYANQSGLYDDILTYLKVR